MTARQPFPRQPSISTLNSNSRRSSISSVRDIFSDEYALEPIDSNLNLSLVDLEDIDEPFSDPHPNFAPYPAIPQRLSNLDRPSSTSKRPLGNDGTARESLLGARLSSSSRLSLPRSQSPYNGPTTPSHPYAMYPQITRASSIASQSTYRPSERPFVHTGGPEHPYALYPQNTVVDEDEDIGTQPIPLGFSALGYGSSHQGSSTEVGDIVLSDGHIEQLPPYTRYADNVVAKGDMANINGSHHTEIDTRTSERATLIRDDAAPSSEAQDSEHETTEISKKRGLREKLQQRVCGGVAMWLLIVILTFVVLAGVLGGVIGGVVGRRQGAAMAAAQAFIPDANPVSIPPNSSLVPIGRYVIPFDQTEQIPSCVAQPQYSVAWDCLDFAYLGMNITINPDTNLSAVQFDDYSVDATTFRYGPQPPDFNGSVIPMEPHDDQDNQDYGVAMFFWRQFNKLIILPYEALRSDGSASPRKNGDKLMIGDEPWYCFWNNTINEFWIFLEKPSAAPYPDYNSSASSVTSLSYTTTLATSVIEATQASTSSPSYAPTATQYNAAVQGKYSPAAPWHDHLDYPEHNYEKRDYTRPYLPLYPKLIKMVEKRKARSNVQPYCQKMKVLNNYVIVVHEDKEIIPLTELEWDSDPITAGTSSNKRKRDTTAQLESNCVCEWMSN